MAIDLTPIRHFLDPAGKLKQWPAKRSLQLVWLEHLAEQFEIDRQYGEKEVNAIIFELHTFNDSVMQRRGLIETGHLKRTADGRSYWRPAKAETK